MRYVFLHFHPMHSYIDKVPSKNFPLYDLYTHFDDPQMRWIIMEEDDNDPNTVIIWSRNNIKEALGPREFDTHEKLLSYIDRYHEYSRKRFAELPAIRITRKNYEALKKQFEGIHQRKSQYLILREHDDGHVDMLEKNELSPEDIANMNREEKIYRNYIKRLEAYQKAHPHSSGIWRTPADNKFESDFALYDPADEKGIE